MDVWKRKRDDWVSPLRQEMEGNSNGAGVLAAQPATFTDNPHPNITAPDAIAPSPADAHSSNMALLDHHNAFFESPDHGKYIHHAQQSNVRENGEDLRSISGADSEAARRAASILATGRYGDLKKEDLPLESLSTEDLIKLRNMNEDSLERTQTTKTAYAKLSMPDGDVYITTHDLILGRNMRLFEEYKQERLARRTALDILEQYRQEPSQPSQPGDEDLQIHPSNSSQSLDGRPAPPSNVSEHGGMVYYQPPSDAEEIQVSSGRKRRSLQFSKSSSTTSVAPASLHPSMTDINYRISLNEDGEPEFRTCAYVPVHTANREDMMKVSKDHIKFSYNFQDEQWELIVLGSGAFVNDHLYQRGSVVRLLHNDEIMMATIVMNFKLPDDFTRSPGPSRGTFSRDGETETKVEESDGSDQAVSTSPVRRLSNAMEYDSEEDEDVVEDPKDVPKLKLKRPNDSNNNVRKQKTTLKGKKQPAQPNSKGPRKDSPNDLSPEASKRAGKKPKAESQKEQKPSPPAPLQIDPNSALANVPTEQLPERRKGPGRPPKNGVLSKRDLGLVTRRIKDYEKRGEVPPPYDHLVAVVRRETKLKEAANKAAANGLPPPDMSVMQSIEPEAGPPPKLEAGSSTNAIDETSAAPAERGRPTSPKPPKRTARSLSPMKPKEECTPAELEKPVGTYVDFLNLILSEHPDGQADLQEIYDRLQKKWPYFKYNSGTTGWQSSVRHNLLSSDRFVDVGKSGKGKFWAIDYNVPIKPEKQHKKPPPQPPQRQQMQNGQFLPPQQQFGQAQYGNPYAPQGQAQMTAGPQAGGYYSPYAQPGQNGGLRAQGMASTQVSTQQPQHQTPAPPPNPNQGLIEEIIDFQRRWLEPFQSGEPKILEKKRALFQSITNYLSDLFHGSRSAEQIMPTLDTEEAKTVFEGLNALFNKHRKPNGSAQASVVEGEKQPDEVSTAVHQMSQNSHAGDVGASDSSALAQTNGVVAPSGVQMEAEVGDAVDESNGAESSSMMKALQTMAEAPGQHKRAADEDEDAPDAKRVRSD